MKVETTCRILMRIELSSFIQHRQIANGNSKQWLDCFCKNPFHYRKKGYCLLFAPQMQLFSAGEIFRYMKLDYLSSCTFYIFMKSIQFHRNVWSVTLHLFLRANIFFSDHWCYLSFIRSIETITLSSWKKKKTC